MLDEPLTEEPASDNGRIMIPVKLGSGLRSRR
jgi:hypothetical protein